MTERPCCGRLALAAVCDRRGYRLLLVGVTTLAFAMGGLQAAAPAKVSIAAAANLVYALDALNAEFKRSAPEISVSSTTGASGSLFAQIKNGAPFDVFLSADRDYPKQAVAAGLGDATTLRTFATGRLVLWTTQGEIDVTDVDTALRSARIKKIAIAQPKSAPYGRAAQATLEKLGAWERVQPKLVFGESISQTAQFVETGNADVGFVAMSLVLSPKLTNKGRWHEVSPELYANVSLDHAGVLTTRGTKNPAAKQYLEFLASDAARKILREFGYGVGP
jgi:molybdate transport system substrate-binding protein